MAFHSMLFHTSGKKNPKNKLKNPNKFKKSLQFLIINWEVIMISTCFFFLLVTFFF